jgi:hypothetical protein
MRNVIQWTWILLTWWKWARCWACNRRVWGVYERNSSIYLLCGRHDCPMTDEE